MWKIKQRMVKRTGTGGKYNMNGSEGRDAGEI